MTTALWILAYLAVPAALVWASARFDIAGRMGPIVLCYLAGLVLGLSGLQPDSAAAMRTSVMEGALALALPLLLFSVDVPAWRRMAGPALLAMGLAIVAIVLVATGLFVVMGRSEAGLHLAAMATGTYTGGIANLGAVKLALDIPDDSYLLFATLDTVVGGVYLLFVLTVAPILFGRLLGVSKRRLETDIDASEAPALTDLTAWITQGGIALIASALCVGAAVFLAPLIPGGNPQILTIVLITSFALALSFVPALRSNPAATPIGLFLIYVFSFCVAASMDLGALSGADPRIFGFVILATFGSFALHALLCSLFGIDRDTFLITSVAAIMSPAFVPMAARRLRAPGLLMSGMAAGILGFAIGNYAAITLALFLIRGTP